MTVGASPRCPSPPTRRAWRRRDSAHAARRYPGRIRCTHRAICSHYGSAATHWSNMSLSVMLNAHARASSCYSCGVLARAHRQLRAPSPHWSLREASPLITLERLRYIAYGDVDALELRPGQSGDATPESLPQRVGDHLNGGAEGDDHFKYKRDAARLCRLLRAKARRGEDNARNAESETLDECRYHPVADACLALAV